jgi:prophage regulatory protein
MNTQSLVLRKSDVLRATGFSPAGLERATRSGAFPRPFKLTPEGRAIGWSAAEVKGWLDQRIAERDAP